MTNYNLTLSDTLDNSQQGISNVDWYQGGGISTVTSYTYDLYNLIWSVETTNWATNRTQSPFSLDLKPTVVDGHATVGIGNDLHTNPTLLSSYFGVSADSVLYADLTGKIKNNDVLQSKLAEAKQPNWGITEAQSKSAWLHNVSIFEGNIDHVLRYKARPSDSVSVLPQSTERLAFVDMEFNGGLLEKSPHLRQDIGSGDRADAWFQITFNDNNFDGESGGIAGNAIRRMEDGALFGLYSSGTTASIITTSEAMDVYSMLSSTTTKASMTNRQFAFNYSLKFQGSIQSGSLSSNPKYGAINNDIDAQLAAQDLPALLRGDLRDDLGIASNKLISEFITDKSKNPYLPTGSVDPSAFDALDVQVATTKAGGASALVSGGSVLTASTRDGYNLAAGNYHSSLLISRDGNDTLDASGTANDVLIGGSGQDVMYVGSGNDYIVAGSGSSVIVGNARKESIGAGNDTIVLGEADKVSDGGHHTVIGGAGKDTYYVGRGNTDKIVLGTGTSIVKLADDANHTATDLLVKAASLNTLTGSSPYANLSGTYIDRSTSSLILTTQQSDHTLDLRVLALPSVPKASERQQLSMARAADSASSWDSLADGIIDFFASSSSSDDDVSLGDARDIHDSVADLESTAADSEGILEIDGYNGENLQGVTLDATTVVPAGTTNLDQLRVEPGSPDNTNYYDDMFSGTVDSIIGSDAVAGTTYTISGSGNAHYIQAGNGEVAVFLGDIHFSATNPLDIDVNGTIQGGTGSQTLVGVGNGHETIVGGSSGVDDSLWTTIDGGGADGVLIGGGQNSVIWGGTGQDTIVASSINSANGQLPYNPLTLAIAGLSFYGKTWYQNPGSGGSVVSGMPAFSVAAISDPAAFQVQVQLFQGDGTYGAAVNLLGSQYDPASVDGDSTLPGSVLVGGTGYDMLLGNSGNDTITGGNPYTPQSGVIDEILVGGAGSDVIYAGSGTDIIFADMTPGAASDWADLDAGHSDTIYGGGGNAYIYGSGGDNVIYGGGGNYTIFVGNGDSYVETGDGNSIVHGGSGNEFIVAGSGHDSIETGDGNTYVFAGGGSSTIVAGAGDDTFEAGEGGTIYYVGGGRETFLIGGSGGDQQIVNASQAEGLAIRFTPEVNEVDILVRRDASGSLLLVNQETGRTTKVSGYFEDGSSQDNVSVRFSDGTTWSVADLLARSMTASTGDDDLWGTVGDDTIVGGLGNDTIRGISGNDVLTGGEGNNTIYSGTGNSTLTGGSGANLLYGGAGSSTYVFGPSSGSDTISLDSYDAGSDTLAFTDGIDPSKVTFAANANGRDLIIQFGDDVASTVTITSFFSNAGFGHQIGSFTFSDGTVLTSSEVAALAAGNQVSDGGTDVLQGGTGDSHILGGSGHDTLIGGSGNNTITGGSGIEVITGGGGRNTLNGGSGYDTITAGSGGDLIDAGSGIAKVIGGEGNDTIGASGAVTSITASGGLDVYRFGLDSGQLTLANERQFDESSKGGLDVLELGESLTSDDLTFTRIGDSYYEDNALVIGIKGTNNYFRIDNYFYGRGVTYPPPAEVPLEIRFANGDVLTYSDVLVATAESASWNGIATGVAKPTPGVDPDAAADYFDRGDGQMALNGSYNLSADDVASGDTWLVVLGQGVRQQDLLLTAQGTDVLISIRGTSDTLLLPGILNVDAEGYAATSLAFADGSSWSVADIAAHTIRGPGAISSESPGDGQDLTFGFGDGQRTVNLSDSYGNVLTLGPDIRSTDIEVIRTLHGIEFVLKATGETLSLVDLSGESDTTDDGDESWTKYPVEEVRFADGAVWTAQNIRSFIASGVSVQGIEDGVPIAPRGTDVITTGMSDSEVFVGSGETLVLFGDGYQTTDGTAVLVHAGASFGNTDIGGTYYQSGGDGSGPDRILQFDADSLADLSITRTFTDVYTFGSDADSSRGFYSDGSGEGSLLLRSNASGHTIIVPYEIDIIDGVRTIIAPVTAVRFADGSVASLDDVIEGAAELSGPIEGARGPETIQGADGDEIHAAIGNTVLLGANQHVLADVSSMDAGSIAETTYVFSNATNSDVLEENFNGKLIFDGEASAGDFTVFRGVDSTYLLYQNDSGRFLSFANADFDLHFSDLDFNTGDNEPGALVQRTPFVTTDSTGSKGYYIDSRTTAGDQVAYVRGTVTNDVFGGLGWSAFDASIDDAVLVPYVLRSKIDSATDNAGVNFTFDTSVGSSEITNYDSGRLNIHLSSGASPSNTTVFEVDGDIWVESDRVDGSTAELRIDDFYAYSATLGKYVQKDLTVSFDDGTVWSSQDIREKMASFTTLGGGSIWIVGSQDAPIDLSPPSGAPTSTTYTNVKIQSDGTNALILGTDWVDLTRGETTLIVTKESRAEAKFFDSSRDSIVIGDGLMPSDLSVVTSSQYIDGHYMDSLVLVERATGNRLLEVGADQIFLNNAPSVSFSDGTVWSFAEMVRALPNSLDGGSVASYQRGGSTSSLLAGTSHNDIIAAGSGADTIDGGGGNDTLYAGVGDDTFIFGAGYGHVTIVGSVGGSHASTIELGTGVSSSTVEVARDGDSENLELRLTASGDSLLLANFLEGATVGSVAFSDGTTWSAEDLVERSYQGGTSSKYLAADASHESVMGGAGDDTVVGDEATDTLGGGSGHDLIRSGGGHNTILIQQGTDTVYGGDGTDVIEVGSGSGTIYGGAGAEAYVFGAAFGATSLYAAGNAVANDIQFTSGVNASDVSFSMTTDGSLAIALDNGAGTILLPGHDLGTDSPGDVGRVFFADGTAASMSSIDGLLRASGGHAVHAVADLGSPGSPAAYNPSNSIHVMGSAQKAPTLPSHMLGQSGTTGQTTAPDGHGDDSLSSPASTTHVATATSTAHPSIGAGDVAMPNSVDMSGGQGVEAHFPGRSEDATSTQTIAGHHGTSRSGSPQAASRIERPVLHAGDAGIRIHGRLGGTDAAPGVNPLRDPWDDGDPGQRSGQSQVPSGGGTAFRQSSGAHPTDSSRHGRMVGRVTDAASAMVKALIAQRTGGGGKSGADDAGWDLSSTDRALASLGSKGDASRAVRAAVVDHADLAHERLIQAMASFDATPMITSSGATSLSDADAIQLAVQAH
jgi:Ca2+-binding RTX toxin-like protein